MQNILKTKRVVLNRKLCTTSK